MESRFVSLRTHSWYSLLEGVSSPQALLERAASSGYQSLALTDTNNLYAACAFAEAARRVGIRPILGARLQHAGQRATALIAEPGGYRSLCTIISHIHLQSGAKLPQILADNNDGLQLLIDDPLALKPPLTERFRGRLWLELVRPGLSEAQEKALLEVGFRLGLRAVASLGARFAATNGHGTFRLVTAIRQGVTLDQLPQRLPIRPAHCLADPDEVAERFRDLPDAVTNAERLAEACRSDVLPRGRVLPPAQVPAGQDAHEYLRLVCEREFPRRQWQDEQAARRKLAQELQTVCQQDFSGHFLVVGDLAQEAKRRGWPMALRGSAGASLVAYLLGITDIDPLRFGLRVERFLNPGREDAPDLDIDLAAQVRSKAWAWLLNRFGSEHAARVGMLQTFQVRSAFRASATAHGVSKDHLRGLLESVGNELEELRFEEPGRLAMAPPSWPLEPDIWPKVLAGARMLLDRPHEWTSHPSGILLTAEPAERCMPLEKGPGGVRLAQLDKDSIERVGLVKLDLLSNRSLSVLAEARQHLQALTPVETAPPGDDADPATLCLLQRGDTLGIGQLETPSMRRLLQQIRPRGLQDLVQALAVTRPGAAANGWKDLYLRRRQGLDPVQYPHPSLEPLLRESWGLLLYEDDAISVIETLTGLPASEADRLRKGLTDPDATEAASTRFISACERNAIPRPVAEAVCGQIQRFEQYGFCKAHAVSYGMIAWQESQFKARHPLAFWTAALNNHQGTYPRRVYVEAAKRAGLQVFLPCVNRSQTTFSEEVVGIRCGLGAIRSLSPAACTAVLEERERGGVFASLSDFRRRMSLTPQDVGLLIRAGSFDFCGRGRELLLREAELIRQGRLPHWWAGKDEDQIEPFPCDELPGSLTLLQQWKDEWELLGFLCGQPLMHLIRRALPAELADSRGLPCLVNLPVRLAGLIAATREAEECETRFLTLEDEWGLVEAILPAGQCVSAELAAKGLVVLIEGQVEQRHGAPLVVASKLDRLLPGGQGPNSMSLSSPMDSRLDGVPARR